MWEVERVHHETDHNDEEVVVVVGDVFAALDDVGQGVGVQVALLDQ